MFVNISKFVILARKPGESEFAHSGFIYYSLHIGYIFNLY